jgi:hypothetical protein
MYWRARKGEQWKRDLKSLKITELVTISSLISFVCVWSTEEESQWVRQLGDQGLWFMWPYKHGGQSRKCPTEDHGYPEVALCPGWFYCFLVKYSHNSPVKQSFLTSLAFLGVNESLREGMGKALGSPVILCQPFEVIVVPDGLCRKEGRRRKQTSRHPSLRILINAECK